MHIAAAADIIARIQDYAVQYCATKSLPFTAATMALDCVSAAINTLVPKEFSAKAVAQLMANGNKSEAKTIRHLNVVKQSVDPGGRGEGYIPQKRKASVNGGTLI